MFDPRRLRTPDQLTSIVLLALAWSCGANPADSQLTTLSGSEPNTDVVSNGSDASSTPSSNDSTGSISNGATTPPVLSPADSTAVVCTTMDFWTGGNRESDLMRPGTACIDCHARDGEGPRFTIAGTLYASPHEPDDCYGIDPSYSAEIVITSADGTEITLTVNSAGNFMYQGRNLALPYQAKVVYNGQERLMATAQTIGDCNSCHTQDGAQGAPGRIQLPL